MPHNRLVREPEQKKPWSILKASVTETAANTYTEASVPTPVSGQYFQAMRVHKIVFDPGEIEFAIEDTVAGLTVQLATRAIGGLGTMATEGMIAMCRQVTRWMSSAAGGESQFYSDAGKRPAIWDFGEQGILVTDNELKLGIQGQAQTAVKTGIVLIYYTLETLQPDEYIAALTVLGSQF